MNNPAQTIVRQAAVAGQFYPGNPDELKQMLGKLLRQVSDVPPLPKAMIVPHAGFIYSGPIAATAYASLLPAKEKITRVVLLGPSHRVFLSGLGLSSASYFSTPLGTIPIDQHTCNSISALPQVSINEQAHAWEHSLEVQLPFLQYLLNQFQLVPLVVGEASAAQVAEIIEHCWESTATLTIVSSDLSHYHDYAKAKRLDAKTSQAIEHLQLEKLGPQQACGYAPLRGLLQVARNKTLRVKTLDLRNSGDTSGPKDRVVGYGAYAVS